MSDHTVKSFSQELEELGALIARMGGLAEDLLTDTLRAVVTQDLHLAETVVDRDKLIDDLQAEVEREIMRILALRQPMAKDLRQTVSAMKVAAELERIGDLSKNIAKRTRMLGAGAPPAGIKGVARMGRVLVAQLNNVLDAYAAMDTEAAVQVRLRDEEVDEHHNALFREVLTYMMEDPRTINGCTHLLFIAKNLERIGDHCTNIAEEIYFLVTGKILTTERPKSDALIDE